VILRYGDDGVDDNTNRAGVIGIVTTLCWMTQQSWLDSRILFGIGYSDKTSAWMGFDSQQEQ
jgi:hypothetical protein